MHSEIRIGLIGDFNQQLKAHQAIPQALAAASGGAEAVWVPTDSVGNGASLAEFDGIWCVPGMPYRSADGAMRGIQHARMTRIPFLATSAGFQYTLIEYARNVLGLGEADHQKTNPKAPLPLVTPLDAALNGHHGRVRFMPGSRLQKAYGAPESTEEYHCSFGFNGRYRRLLEGRDLCVAAVDTHDEIRAVELESHPFFVATHFQPELHPGTPLVNAFVVACERRRHGATKAAS